LSSRCTYRRVRVRVVFGSLSSTKVHLENTPLVILVSRQDGCRV